MNDEDKEKDYRVIYTELTRTIGPAQLSLYEPFPSLSDLVIAMVDITKCIRVVWDSNDDPPLELDGLYLTDWQSQGSETIANYRSSRTLPMKVPYGATKRL